MKSSNNKYIYPENKDLRQIYFKIKEKVNELLFKYNDASFVENPSVDIKTIVTENGITKVEYVSLKDISDEHAVLDGSIIKINKNDSNAEMRFSLAHELKHFISKEPDILRKKSDISKKIDKNEVKEVDDLVARCAKKYKSKIRKSGCKKIFKMISICIAGYVSHILGKKVSKEKAFQILEKKYFSYFKNESHFKPIDRGFITGAMINTANKLYDEEIADYFAANLLIPTERFILWEDKSDRKIAKAFNVPKECVKKRRREIKYELDFMALEDLSSG